MYLAGELLLSILASHTCTTTILLPGELPLEWPHELQDECLHELPDELPQASAWKMIAR